MAPDLADQLLHEQGNAFFFDHSPLVRHQDSLPHLPRDTSEKQEHEQEQEQEQEHERTQGWKHKHQQGQEQEREQKQKKKQKGRSIASPCTSSPGQPIPQLESPRTRVHNHRFNHCTDPTEQYQKCQQFHVAPWTQEKDPFPAQRLRMRTGDIMFIPPTPDPGYLETLDDYFSQSHILPFDDTESHSGNDSQTEDSDDHQDEGTHCNIPVSNAMDTSTRERRRSRSICGPLLPMETALGSPMSFESDLQASPAMDRPLTTPPPSSRLSHTPRRRHHSCVAPNTKEFHTLATIFGWVTLSGWSDPCHDLHKGADEPDICSSQYFSDSQPIACESDDDTDLDGILPHGDLVEWNTLLDSSSFLRDSELGDYPQDSIQDQQYSNDVAEYLPGASGLGLLSTAVQQGLHSHFGHQMRGLRSPCKDGGRERVSIPITMSGVDYVASRSISTQDTSMDASPATEQMCSQDVVLSSKGLEKKAYGRDIERPFLSHANGIPLMVETRLESFTTSINERSLSQTHGKDSGYISLKSSFLNRPLETIPIEQESAESSLDCTDDSTGLTMQEGIHLDADFEQRTECKTPSPDVLSASQTEMHINPPRYLEIDSRVFDHTEDEGLHNIIYVPQETVKRDPFSGTSEVRPIIAATIVKLIEKLTHQYGMDSGFLSDFFLTYRLFMSPVQLCKYLIQRYLWALEQDTESRCVVRVRTFVVFRYWINNHFADDFLTSKSLRFQMASFLNSMRSHSRVQASPRDSRIIRSLMDFFKHQRRYYKNLAERSLAEQKSELGKRDSQQDCQRISHFTETEDRKASEVERLEVSPVPNHIGSSVIKGTSNDSTSSLRQPPPVKGRHRASTLAGPTPRSATGEPHGSHPTPSKPISSESRAQSMSRQLSEGGAVAARERRLSTSSNKSTKSANWSTKMSMGFNKLRQKSEDIYQQFVHPASLPKNNALNTTRSHPSLKPSVVITNVGHESTSPQLPAPQTSFGLPSYKPMKRLKSPINLGLSSPAVMPSPVPSPTRNQFSSMSNRHSRTNSNSSVGYHPNPDCPYHVLSLCSTSRDTAKKPQEALDRNACTTLKEALLDDYEDLLPQSHFAATSSSIPTSPGWQYCPLPTTSQQTGMDDTPVYKPFILCYRSQMIAQQLCLLEEHFLEQIRWDELLEVELIKAGRKNRSKNQPSIGGYLFKTNGEWNGMKASNERSNMLCMWVASEVVSTHPIEDRVRVIEKFIRIAQKCYQYRNFNSLIQLVMGLGCSHLSGLRRTWSRVGSYEMRILEDLQHFISPCGNWRVLRKAMNQVGYNETMSEGSHKASHQETDNSMSSSTSAPDSFGSDAGHGKCLQPQVPLEKQGCIPFLGLFVFDLTHITVSPPWYLPLTCQSEDSPGSPCPSSTPAPSTSINHPSLTAQLQAPDPGDLQSLLPTGTLLVHFYRFQLIAKTIKWFLAFQRRPQKYTFTMDSTLYSKCLMLRVLSNDRVRELADRCEGE